MSVNNPITSFGIYQATIQDLETLEMFQMLILDSAEPDFSQELVDLRGGGSAFPWASAPGEANGEIKMTVKQFDAGVLKFFSPWESGSITEDTDGEASGNVSTVSNHTGTSIVAATGITNQPVVIPSTGTLKLGDYVLVAEDSNTLGLYVNTDVDGLTFIDDTLKLGTVDISTGANCDLAAAGLRFVGGASATSFTIGDKATFSVRPINSYYMQHQIGRIGAAPREFALTIVGERLGNKIRMARYPKCISSGGAGLKFLYKDWATFETTIKILQDVEAGYVGLETILNR